MTSKDSVIKQSTGIDWKSILLFVVLMAIGWFNIYATVYNESISDVFDFSQKYGLQLIWIGISLIAATVIIFIDDIFYHVISYPFYAAVFVVLVVTLFVGKEVNGSKAWLDFGFMSIQPAEFMKIATAMALARYMSEYKFSLKKSKDLLVVSAIILLPMVVIILQNDLGSAIVYSSFLVMLYREGLNAWVYLVLFLVVGIFIFSFLLTPITLLILLILFCVVSQVIANKNYKDSIIYVAMITLATVIIYFGVRLFGVSLSLYWSLLFASAASLVVVAIYAYRRKLAIMYLYVSMFLGSLLFIGTVDYIFDNVLKEHQQKRILHLLDLESDLKHWGYNVNQSKIAIGSGGFLGKGYLDGTQTKYNFIPEQSTDFIFCTVGEEWGFVGSTIVLALFCLLILRLMKMGERQQEPFRRVYCYCVAGIFLFHIGINIGMTIGLMPVIGIPLPLFSYGGSSLLAFTMLFFIAVRLDLQNK